MFKILNKIQCFKCYIAWYGLKHGLKSNLKKGQSLQQEKSELVLRIWVLAGGDTSMASDLFSRDEI